MFETIRDTLACFGGGMLLFYVACFLWLAAMLAAAHDAKHAGSNHD